MTVSVSCSLALRLGIRVTETVGSNDAEYLVGFGIDSMSPNPDTVLKTTQQVLDAERRRGHEGDGRESADSMT